MLYMTEMVMMIDVCDKIHRQLIIDLDGNKSWNITMYELGFCMHNKPILWDHISNTTKWNWYNKDNVDDE